MQEQFEMEQLADVFNNENESKVKEQSELIENLESQLNVISQ